MTKGRRRRLPRKSAVPSFDEREQEVACTAVGTGEAMAYKRELARSAQERGSQKLFGTDGVRGVANVYPMTAEVAMQLGRALAYLIRNGPHRHRVVIGKD